MDEGGGRVSVRVLWSEKTSRSLLAGFEDGKGPQAKGSEQPLEAGESKEMDSLLEPPERM